MPALAFSWLRETETKAIAKSSQFPHSQNHEQVLTPEILVNDELSHGMFFLDQRKQKKIGQRRCECSIPESIKG